LIPSSSSSKPKISQWCSLNARILVVWGQGGPGTCMDVKLPRSKREGADCAARRREAFACLRPRPA
jgi:hypothetical protein